MIDKVKMIGLFMALFLTLSALPARANFSTDLQALVSQSNAVNSNLAIFSFSDQSCSDLGLLNNDIEALVAAVEAVSTGLPEVLNLSTSDLDSLDSLSALGREMGLSSVRLSTELQDVANIADLFEYRAALSAVLALSDDIGAMADRILEMGDRILVMADNIGTMADRILISLQIQSANLALTQTSLLTTQQNMILLSASISSIIYNVSLGTVVADGNSLLDDMAMINLTSENMAQELIRLQAVTAILASRVEEISNWVNSSSQSASHYINGDTLTTLGDLSDIYTGLGFFLESYAATINQLAPLTDTVILSDATAAMLRLTADIGVMSGRIMEMLDKIIIMADNIGLMADNIVITQQLQQANMELTESSLLAAQNITITIIKNMGL